MVFDALLKGFFLRRRRSHKHLLVTKKLSAYIDALVEKTNDEVVATYTEETRNKPNNHLQTEVSEARFISVLVEAIGAKKVLELGTFRGFLSVQVAEVLRGKGKITTCDSRKNLIDEAYEFARRANVLDVIDFKHGDAAVVCAELIANKELFDLVFIDADKMNYEKYLELAYSLVRDGSVILIDNTLWSSLVAYDTPDKIAGMMKSVNEHVFNRFGKHAAIIPAWDGVTMIVIHK